MGRSSGRSRRDEIVVAKTGTAGQVEPVAGRAKGYPLMFTTEPEEWLKTAESGALRSRWPHSSAYQVTESAQGHWQTG